MSAVFVLVLGGCGTAAAPAPFGLPPVQPPSSDIEHQIDTSFVDPLYGYIASVGGGVHLISLTFPAKPVLVATDDYALQAHSVKVAGDQLFVADQTDGLRVYDITTPMQPSLFGVVDTYRALDAVFVNDHVYVADQLQGLAIVELGPISPTVTGQFAQAGFALSVDASPNVLMVAAQSEGFRTIDAATDPHDPTVLATVDTPDTAYDVVVRGTYAFVTDYTAGLIIVDVTNPAQPEVISETAVPGRAFRVAVEGRKAYVAAREGGVSIIDISDPSAPQLQNVVGTLGEALGVAAHETFLFVTDDTQGLLVVHVEPTQGVPLLRAVLDVPGAARDIVLVK